MAFIWIYLAVNFNKLILWISFKKILNIFSNYLNGAIFLLHLSIQDQDKQMDALRKSLGSLDGKCQCCCGYQTLVKPQIKSFLKYQAFLPYTKL